MRGVLVFGLHFPAIRPLRGFDPHVFSPHADAVHAPVKAASLHAKTPDSNRRRLTENDLLDRFSLFFRA